MLTSYLTSLVSLACAAPLPPAPPKPPEGPPPQFTTVAQVRSETGELLCTETAIVFVPVAVTEVVDVMGVKKTVTRVVTEHRQQTRTVAHSLKECKAQTADGKALTAEDLVKRLTPGTPILLMTASDKVDPTYLKIIKPDTVILFAPLPKPGFTAPTPQPLPERRP